MVSHRLRHGVLEPLDTEARLQFGKIRPGLLAEKVGLEVASDSMSDTLINLGLRELLCDEPPFTKLEFLAVQNLLDVGELARRQEVGLGNHTCASLSSATILDKPERCRCLHVLICSTSKEN